MALFLLDTSVCVDLLRGWAPSTDVPSPDQCCLSAIVTAELRFGLAKGPSTPERKQKLEELVNLFPVRDFDDAAAGHYGEIRADLERRGAAIGPLDLLIAGHARSLGATLLTGNAREFRRVRKLKVRSWRRAAVVKQAVRSEP